MEENTVSIYHLLNAYCHEASSILGCRITPTYSLSSINGSIATLIMQIDKDNRVIAQIDMAYDYETDGINFSISQHCLNLYPNCLNQKTYSVHEALAAAETALKAKGFPLYENPYTHAKDSYAVSISDFLFQKIYKKCNQQLQILEKNLRQEISISPKDAVSICEITTQIHDTATMLLYLQQEKRKRKM